MPFYLQTNAVPGTANWVFETSGTVAPVTGLTFVDATYAGARPSDGSIAAPFTTIQDALDSIGTANTVAEQFQGWKVIVSAGFYDEDLTIPERRSILLDCAPDTFLGDAFPPTSARTITWPCVSAPLLPAFESYSLQINNLVMFNGIDFQTSAPAVAPIMNLRLNQVSFLDSGPGMTIASISALNLIVGTAPVELQECALIDENTGFFFDAGPTNRAYIHYASNCEFEGGIIAQAYGQMVDCKFRESPSGAADHLYTNQASIGISSGGFFSCEFGNANPHIFTILPIGVNLARVDGVSWNFLSANWTFVNALVVGLSNPHTGGNTAGGTANWAPGGDSTMSNALERIATAVSGLLVAPIP